MQRNEWGWRFVVIPWAVAYMLAHALFALFELPLYLLALSDCGMLVQALTAYRLPKVFRPPVIGNQFNIIVCDAWLRLPQQFLALVPILTVGMGLLAAPSPGEQARRVPPKCEMVFCVLQLLLLLR